MHDKVHLHIQIARDSQPHQWKSEPQNYEGRNRCVLSK
jgi:hypothetical protein